MLIDDIRRAALARLQSLAMTHWTAKIGSQGELAGEAMTHLGRNALRHGSTQRQTTLVHVATNSVEFLWLEDAAGAPPSIVFVAVPATAISTCPIWLTARHRAESPSGRNYAAPSSACSLPPAAPRCQRGAAAILHPSSSSVYSPSLLALFILFPFRSSSD